MQEQSELATPSLAGWGGWRSPTSASVGRIPATSELGLVELAASSLVAPLGSRQPGRGTAD